VANYKYTDPFCDWLNVTCDPDNSFVPAMLEFLDFISCPVAYADDEKILIDVGFGKVKITMGQKSRFHSVSASGSVLSHLRSSNLFSDYLSVLASVPHKVTRLDAAIDLSVDAPLYLRMLERQYPDDRVKFTRKTVKVTRLYSARESDGKQSGSWYAGNYGKARLTARVYDKQLEALDNRGESLPPTTRIELTFAKDFGCTLKDASMPASLFFTHCKPVLDTETNHVVWESYAEAWEGTPLDVPLDWQIYQRRLQNSPEIAALIVLAAKLGPTGKDMLMRNFEKHLDAGLRDYPSRADKLGITK
jgi:hypothetical protein